MRVVVQRVSSAAVAVAGLEVARTGPGLLVLLAVAPGDGEPQARWLAGKVARLRIFEDDGGKMNRSVVDVGGGALVVSQFTLYADCRKGNRPNFQGAAAPAEAERLYGRFAELLAAEGVPVGLGVFGAMMDVSLVNAGPVTLIVDAPETVDPSGGAR